MLNIKELTVAYGQSQILHKVNFYMNANDSVAIVGKNGMSKTSFFKTLMGLLPIQSGKIEFLGNDITSMATFERARLGIAYVPQGRLLFPQLTVEENLLTGLETRRLNRIPKIVFELFPILHEMKDRKAGNLSGGQQQMVAIGRALSAGPKLLILDEPTEGLQPSIIKEIARALLVLQDQTDCTVLLSEQVLSFAVTVADRLVVMERGRIVQESGKAPAEIESVKIFLTI